MSNRITVQQRIEMDAVLGLNILGKSGVTICSPSFLRNCKTVIALLESMQYKNEYMINKRDTVIQCLQGLLEAEGVLI